MGRGDAGVTTRGVDINANIKVTFLCNSRNSTAHVSDRVRERRVKEHVQNAAVLFAESTTLVNDHLESIFAIARQKRVRIRLGTLRKQSFSC